MSETERLRAMLDERGVEHWDTEGITEYRGEYGRIVRCYSRLEPITLDVAIIAAPPEQAIEATLGRGECRMEIKDNLNESEGMGDVWFECSECHWQGDYQTTPVPLHYCPNCGRKVRE